MASITIDIDLPEGVEITGYERRGQGHGFEVTWPWPERCRCQCCSYEDQAHLEQNGKPRVIRHLDGWERGPRDSATAPECCRGCRDGCRLTKLYTFCHPRSTSGDVRRSGATSRASNVRDSPACNVMTGLALLSRHRRERKNSARWALFLLWLLQAACLVKAIPPTDTPDCQRHVTVVAGRQARSVRRPPRNRHRTFGTRDIA